MYKKYIDLVKNEEFVNAVNSAKNEDEVLAVAQQYGVEVSTWDEFIALANEVRQEMIAEAGDELSDDELLNVAGGKAASFCFIFGFGDNNDDCNAYFGLGWCVVYGDSGK